MIYLGGEIRMKKFYYCIFVISAGVLFLANTSLSSQDLKISDADKEELILLSIEYAKGNKIIIEREKYEIEFITKSELVKIRFKPKQEPGFIIFGGVYIFTGKKINGKYKITDYEISP